MPGRPRILSEEKQSHIVHLIATGCTIAAAARYMSCSVLTIRREARRNPKFQESLRRARIGVEIGPIDTMRMAARSQWRAAAWLLERTQPQRYAKRAPNSFSQDEVVELLSRVCDVVRQETRDAQKFARIRRRVRALAQSFNRPASARRRDEPIREQLPPPPNPSDAEAVLPANVPPSGVAAQVAGSPSAAAPPAAQPRAGDQNGIKKAPAAICLADIPSRVSRSFSPQHGSP